MNRRHTLVINRWDTYCGHCGKSAVMSEATHETVPPGYAPGPATQGCGVRWVLADSDYMGLDPTICRPDLAPTGFAAENPRWTVSLPVEEQQ